MTDVKVNDYSGDMTDLKDCEAGWAFKFFFEGGNSSIWLCLDVENKIYFVDLEYFSTESIETLKESYDPINRIIPIEKMTITLE